MVHEGLKDGQYLCEVSGFKHTRFMVLRHDECGWWQYVKRYDMDAEGWCALDECAKVVRYLTLLEEDKE